MDPIQYTAQVKSCEYLKDGSTKIRFDPYDKDVSNEGAGQVVISGHIPIKPGSYVDVTIEYKDALQFELFAQKTA